MSEFAENPVWDQLCLEWNVPPASGVQGLVTVIEGLCQSQVEQKALPSAKLPPALPVAQEAVSEPNGKVIEGNARVRVTRKVPKPA